MKKFWKWKNQAATEMMPAERTLHLSGTIAEESWFDDDVTPQLFREELMSGSGDITVWINSPGGDCVAAAQIYNMLMDYPGNVTVKIDGIAASAASVIAMAGTTVLMSPVSMMIHNPMTGAFGDSAEMQKAIEMLASVKDSIINGMLSYFMMNAHLFELSGVIKERLDVIFEEYGIKIQYFNMETIEVPEADYKKVSEAKERRTSRMIEGYTWQEERQTHYLSYGVENGK